METHTHEPAPFFPGSPHGLCRTCRQPLNRTQTGVWEPAPKGQFAPNSLRERDEARLKKLPHAYDSHSKRNPTGFNGSPSGSQNDYSVDHAVSLSNPTPFAVFRNSPVKWEDD